MRTVQNQQSADPFGLPKNRNPICGKSNAQTETERYINKNTTPPTISPPEPLHRGR